MLLQVVLGLTAGAVNAATADAWFGSALVVPPELGSEGRAAFETFAELAVRALQVFVAFAAVANAGMWAVTSWATRDGQAWPRAVATILGALAVSSAATLPLILLAAGSAPDGSSVPAPEYSPWTLVLAGSTGAVTVAAAALLWTRSARTWVEDSRLRP